MVFVSKHKSC